MVRLGRDSGTRLRVYGRDGVKRADSWAGAAPTYALRDPADEPWYRERGALALDNGFDAIVGARRPPDYCRPRRTRLEAWPEARRRWPAPRPRPSCAGRPTARPMSRRRCGSATAPACCWSPSTPAT